jgi:hypothetical protein
MASRRRTTGHHDDAEVDIRNEEVLRANRELAAYFKGKRTEREARAALKIIKGFIRYREKISPSKRLPLPGAPKRDRAVPPNKRRTLTVVAEGE